MANALTRAPIPAAEIVPVNTIASLNEDCAIGVDGDRGPNVIVRVVLEPDRARRV